MRYEITGCATDVFPLEDIQNALRSVGARNVRHRNAYGWWNQPSVATFRADSDAEAERIADAARATLRPGTLPVLLPYSYGSK